jgi:hypothetical protein
MRLASEQTSDAHGPKNIWFVMLVSGARIVCGTFAGAVSEECRGAIGLGFAAYGVHDAR